MVNHSPKVLPTTLLLGGGYVLQKVASMLKPNTFLITSRYPETVAQFKKLGWCSSECDTTAANSLSTLIKETPSLTTVIDSIPPQFTENSSNNESGSIEAQAESRINALIPSIKKAIYLSTTGVYGVDDGSWVDESTKVNPNHLRSEARVTFEKCYANTFNESTILRIPAIYGPGRGVGASLKAGRYPLIGGGERWSNRIHVEDLARTIVFLLSLKSMPKILCVADSEPTRSIDIINYYCQKFNLPFPKSIPYEEAKARGLHTILSNQRVSSKLLREHYNFSLTYPTFKEGAETECA